MKKFLLPTAVVLCVLSLLVSAFKTTETPPTSRIGYLSINELVSEIPEYQMQRGKLDTIIYEFNVALQSKVAEFQEKQQAYVQDSASMNEVIKTDRFTELQSLSQSIQAFKQVSEEEVAKRDSSLVQPILTEVQSAIDQVAGEYGYTHILNTDVRAQNGPPMVLFAQEETNLKNLVLEEYTNLQKNNKQ